MAKTAAEIREERANLVAQAENLTKENREWPPEEQAKFDELS